MKAADFHALANLLKDYLNDETVQRFVLLIDRLFPAKDKKALENDTSLKGAIVLYHFNQLGFNKENACSATVSKLYNNLMMQWLASFEPKEMVIDFLLRSKRDYVNDFSEEQRNDFTFLIVLNNPKMAAAYLARNGLITYQDDEAIQQLKKLIQQFGSNKAVFSEGNLVPLIRRSKNSQKFGKFFVESFSGTSELLSNSTIQEIKSAWPKEYEREKEVHSGRERVDSGVMSLNLNRTRHHRH